MKETTIGERIKVRREQLGLTQEELAFKIGYASRSSINKIEIGAHNLTQSKIVAFADALLTTPSYIMGWEDLEGNEIKKEGHYFIPILGNVAAGTPIEMVQDIKGYLEVDEKEYPKENHFALRIKGDSMAPRIDDGDTVIVRQQSDAESGDIVIACVNGDSATCKKLLKYSGGITLMPLNPTHEPRSFSESEIMDVPVTILGKVVENRQVFK